MAAAKKPDKPTGPTTESLEIAARIRFFLAKKGMSQSALAKKRGVSDTTVHRWVTRGAIGSDHLVRLPDALGVEPGYFWAAKIEESGAEG
jgi:transcriptional regulator with XRE-family HTH domain